MKLAAKSHSCTRTQRQLGGNSYMKLAAKSHSCTRTQRQLGENSYMKLAAKSHSCTRTQRQLGENSYMKLAAQSHRACCSNPAHKPTGIQAKDSAHDCEPDTRTPSHSKQLYTPLNKTHGMVDRNEQVQTRTEGH